MSFDDLRKQLEANQADRLAKQKAKQSNKPRHTIYKGDRTIQQLGQDPIENSVVINNQSLAIGDVMLPLAIGNVLRRVDNTNGGALLGSAYRDALENDFDANGRRRGSGLGRNGGIESSDPSSTNRPRRNRARFPPPFGCTPPPPTCFWSNDPIAPEGFQNYGDAVVNENGIPLYLHCVTGTSVAANLNCGFLDAPPRYRCQGGVCVVDPNGVYASLAECQAALIPPAFTGGQCVGVLYGIEYKLVSVVDGRVAYQTGLGSPSANDPIPYSDAVIAGTAGTYGRNGAIAGVLTFTSAPFGGINIILDGIDTGLDAGFILEPPPIVTINRVVRADLAPDLCGNPPSSCPI